jgi:hypothetical protein
VNIDLEYRPPWKPTTIYRPKTTTKPTWKTDPLETDLGLSTSKQQNRPAKPTPSIIVHDNWTSGVQFGLSTSVLTSVFTETDTVLSKIDLDIATTVLQAQNRPRFY